MSRDIARAVYLCTSVSCRAFDLELLSRHQSRETMQQSSAAFLFLPPIVTFIRVSCTL